MEGAYVEKFGVPNEYITIVVYMNTDTMARGELCEAKWHDQDKGVHISLLD